jgi:hypothetical protein
MPVFVGVVFNSSCPEHGVEAGLVLKRVAIFVAEHKVIRIGSVIALF